MILALLLSAQLTLPTQTVSQIASGIERIENSRKSPFGVESVKIKGKTRKERWEYARRICINSINNNWQRWREAGKPGDFLTFMGKRYCPLDYRNWSRNLRSVLKKRGFDFSRIE